MHLQQNSARPAQLAGVQLQADRCPGLLCGGGHIRLRVLGAIADELLHVHSTAKEEAKQLPQVRIHLIHVAHTGRW